MALMWFRIVQTDLSYSSVDAWTTALCNQANGSGVGVTSGVVDFRTLMSSGAKCSGVSIQNRTVVGSGPSRE